MKPSARESENADFLGGPFVSIPHELFTKQKALALTTDEFVVILQIFSAFQVSQEEFLAPQVLSERCALSTTRVGEIIEALIARGYLTIGERLNDDGTYSHYFDLQPLWSRLRGKNPLKSPVREFRKDLITLFEEEFGRPLSGLECEQVRQWTASDNYPEWMITEALREAVLANKFSFKYIDRILFDWGRNRIRTIQELEAYRQTYRERIQAREETAASNVRRTPQKSGQTPPAVAKKKDERYTAFYELFSET